MINVTVLGFNAALGTAITGINDLLCLAGVAWNRIHGDAIQRAFNVSIASAEQQPIRCLNNLLIMPHISLETALDSAADIVLVPTIGGRIDQTLEDNQAVIEALESFNKRHCVIGSNCTGAFMLAEAGLLDHKQATTHWGFANQFSERYPNIKLNADLLITDDSNILCAGGGIAWLDLGLYLIERYCDHDTAIQTAKSFVIDMGRSSQLSYSPLTARKYHKDNTVLAIQTWLEKNFQNYFSIESVAEQFGISNRSLIRRFKEATGVLPSTYLQDIRLDAARKRLEQSSLSIDEITQLVGYQDVSSFTKLFKKRTGATPYHYRNRFNKQ